ncbi:hypothetical protein H9L39_20031 [Fusarium oxysporum f. sp. albedinis]|nr:hypothetical protein H9L39_20031 [Fusarium oxysporum f. sp. albedinis]
MQVSLFFCASMDLLKDGSAMSARCRRSFGWIRVRGWVQVTEGRVSRIVIDVNSSQGDEY